MNRVAGVFDDWARRGRAEGMESGHLRTAAPVLSTRPWGPGRRVLDLGCGNAWAAAWAVERGADAVAVDLAREMVERAARRGLDAARTDMQALPFVDGAFTDTWSMEALYYAPDPDCVLREIHRILRPGGRVDILIDFYAENEASHGWPDGLGVPMALRSEPEWRDALATAGFTDVGSGRLTAGPDAEAWKQREGTLHLHATRPPRNG